MTYLAKTHQGASGNMLVTVGGPRTIGMPTTAGSITVSLTGFFSNWLSYGANYVGSMTATSPVDGISNGYLYGFGDYNNGVTLGGFMIMVANANSSSKFRFLINGKIYNTTSANVVYDLINYPNLSPVYGRMYRWEGYTYTGGGYFSGITSGSKYRVTISSI